MHEHMRMVIRSSDSELQKSALAVDELFIFMHMHAYAHMHDQMHDHDDDIEDIDIDDRKPAL